MAPLSLQIAQMVDILPEPDQKLALELVKKLVLAWDPDYTKSTPAEAEAMNQAIKEIEAGNYALDSEIDWD